MKLPAGTTRRSFLIGVGALGTAQMAAAGGRAQSSVIDHPSESGSVPAPFVARVRPAPQLQLFDDSVERSDCNSPVLRLPNRSLVFVSAFQPVGHTYRRIGSPGLQTLGPVEPITIVGSPPPREATRWDDGRWLESVYRHPAGRLYGWYHAEATLANSVLVVPRVGAMVSDDEGMTWTVLGDLLVSEENDSSFENGFVAGGLGDFCVLVDGFSPYTYIYASAYGPAEDRQGIIAARFLTADLDRPWASLELWLGSKGWRQDGPGEARPILPPERSWRYADPTAFWGPSIHFNRSLGVYVMLLNRTASGTSDWRQDGIYVSFNPDLGDAANWSSPQRIINGGPWYPQVVGTSFGDGDTLAGAAPRLFLSGFSAWELTFLEVGDSDLPEAVSVPPEVGAARAQASQQPYARGRGSKAKRFLRPL